MKPLRSDQRKALAQIEPHLVTEDGDRPDARSVVFARAVVERMLHQIEVLLHFRTRPFPCLPLAPVICHRPYAIWIWLTGSGWLGRVLAVYDRRRVIWRGSGAYPTLTYLLAIAFNPAPGRYLEK